MNTRSALYSVLISGVVMGLLSSLPVLNLVNCILCIWVWLCGALAVILYRRYQRGQAGPTAGQAAGLGALAGLVGAAVGAVVFLSTAALSTPMFDALARALEIEGDFPFKSGTPADYVTQTLLFLVVDIVLYPIFAALGGLIAARILQRPRSAA